MPPPAYPLVGPGVRRLLVFFVLILGTLVASAQTLTQLRNTGPRDRRMNIVFVAEAFTANQEAEFNRQVDVISNAFIADEAYARFAGYINTFRLFVASNEAGPDEPDRGIAHDTYFGSYISGGQLSVSDLSRFQRVLGEQIPDFDLAILIVNLGTAQPDRSGFAYINSGLAFIGSHSNDLNSAALTALHEAGHAFAGLYDEYAYATPSATQAPATVNVVNVSSASDRSQVSWSRFVLPGTPTPTNDAWYSDLGLDAVGTYAGAWYRSDLYRPTSNSRMRILNGPWGPVNLRAIASAMHRLNLESPTGPPTIVQQPSAADVAVGQALTLTVQASGTGPISYQWMRDSRFLDKGHQSTFTIPAMSRQDAGVYAVDVTNAFGSVTSVNVTVTVHDGADGHWSDQDIGAVGVSGMAVDAGATKTLRGSGSDIWDAADEFHFLYQTLSGDGSITARLTQFWINHYVNFAKAGLMFRDSLQANARHASVLYHLAYGRALQYRSTVGGQSGSSPFGTPGPGWLRLTRTGDTFTAYDSSDGVSWQLVASVTITGMPATLYVGLATTAHDDSQLLTAEFKNVAIATGATGTPIPPSGLSAAAISANQINLAWTDASTNETGFEIERAQGSGAFARIATVGANTTSYTDTTVAGSTTYSYRVRATGSTGPSAYSGTATATTPVTPPTSGDWNSRDVGTNLGRAGSSSDDAGTITVHGAGADIWERNDAFHYRYRGWSGDGEFIARVSVLTNPNSWAKGGLMIRESLDANSRHALMCVSAGHGTAFQYRTQTGLDTSSSTATETGGTVQWVRLVRAGSTITGYASPDGITWTLAGSTTIAFPADVYVGFAVTSHTTTALCDVRFDNVSFRTSGTPPPATLAAPTSLSATTISSSQINLTWTDNSNNEDGFAVERSTDGATFTGIDVVGANVTTWVNPGLTAGTTYTYRVRAYRGTDRSDYSNTATATTTAAAPLPAPSFLTANLVSDTQITLRWTDNSSDENGFEVFRATDGTNFVSVGTVAANATTFANTGLAAATTYSYRVRATRGTDQSAFSNQANAITPTPTFPRPTNLVASATDSSHIQLTWTDNSGDEDGFEVERSTDGIVFSGTISVGPNITSLESFGLDAATTYIYRMRAIRGAARSSYSNTATATTAAVYVPGPVNLTATAVSSTRVDLNWTYGGNVQDGFHIERAFGDTGNFVEIGTVGANVTTFADTGVAPSTGYRYRVRATAGSSFSAYAQTSIITPAGPAPGPLVAPGALTATAVSATRIILNWTDNSNDEDGFEVERSTDGTTFVATGTVGANTTSFASTGLTPSTSYTYRVRATRGTDRSAYSGTAIATTPAAPSPAPTNLTATAISSTRIDLSWTDAGTTEDGFRIERVVGADSFAEIATVGANITTFSDTNVTANVTYEYRVRAIYGTTNSEYSNQASATPPAPPPPPPPPTDWLRADIGAVGIAGSDDMTANPAVIRGSGSDIWEGADAFHFVYRSLSGDGSIVARITGISNTNAWAKAGVMIRESLAVGARNTFVLLSAGNGMAVQNRAATGGATTSTPNGVWGQVAPQWVRLTRTGNTVTTEWSSNGTSWSPIASFTVGYGADALIGLAVTSHNNGALCTANFTDVGVTGGTPPPPPPPAPPAAPTTLTATATSSSAITLAWTDASSNETGFEVERSTDNSTFSLRTTTVAGATSFADSGLTASSTYYYRVRAVNAAGASGYSNTASAVTQAMPPPPPPPTPPAAPTGLSATVSSSSAIALAWTDASNNETGFEVERSIDNATFSLRTTTTAGATTFNDTGLTAATTFYYRVRAVNAAGNSSYSNTATARTSDAPPPPPPATWDTRDIGAVARAGSVAAIDGGIALSGSGEDIWNNADEFRYYYQAMTGDGELIARVTGLTNTNGWAKAGVMFRESLNANAAHAFMCVSIDHGTSFQYRAATGGDSATSTPSEVAGAIRWVRLVRTGNTIAGYESENGTTWTPVMTRTFSFPTTIFVGLAVTSHNDGTNATATFTNITLTTGSTPPPPPPPPPATVNAPSALSATAASSTQINLAWTDNATNETGFEIERGVGSVSFSTLAAVGADRTGYSDTTVTAGTTYSYRVRAVAGSVTSAYSNSASATPTATPPPPPPTTWSFGDIGGVGVTGSNTSDSNSITVRGSGSDIWERADGFRFVYRAMTGDGVVEAQVTSIQNTNGWAKAGVMIRESLAAGSSNAAAFVSSEHGVVAQTRATTNGDTQSVAGSVASAPYWLRLTRSGNNFTAASSADGVTWTTFATFTIPMNATAYFGFAVTAHDNSQLNTAVFTDPSVH